MKMNGADSRGIVLIGVVLLMLTMALIGGVLASTFISVLISSRTHLERAQALYLAEAGIARAISDLRTSGSSGGSGPRIIFPTPLGSGEYEVSHDIETGLITSTGRVQQVERTVQFHYRPL